MQQFNTYKLQELFQIVMVHQFNSGYCISDEYLILYIHEIIQSRVPLTVNIFGEEEYLRYDEKSENYLHPSDVFMVNIPKLWKKVFYNDLLFYQNSFVSNVYIRKAVCDTLMLGPASTTILPPTRTEASRLGLEEKNEGLDKLPP